jgi:hypothetical protein
MELRIAQACAGLILAAAFGQAQELEYPARHKRLRRDCLGLVRLEADKLAFAGRCSEKKEQRLEWPYQELQTLELFADRVKLRGYRDRTPLGGKDEEWEFRFEVKVKPAELYLHFRDRMDRRLIARIPHDEGVPLWSAPAKDRRQIRGHQGILIAYPWGLVFRSPEPGASRTWRDSDLDNISSSDPLQLVVATLEGEFEFQLKRELDRAKYEELWMRLNRPRGLSLIPTTP